jgi:hypothetical protein
VVWISSIRNGIGIVKCTTDSSGMRVSVLMIEACNIPYSIRRARPGILPGKPSLISYFE